MYHTDTYGYMGTWVHGYMDSWIHGYTYDTYIHTYIHSHMYPYVLVSVAGMPLSFITPSFPTALHEDLQTIEYGALQKKLVLIGSCASFSLVRSASQGVIGTGSVCDVTKFTNYMPQKGLS